MKVILNHENTSKAGACTIKVFEDYSCIIDGVNYENVRIAYDKFKHLFDDHRGHDHYNICYMLTEMVIDFESQDQSQ